MVDHLGSVSVVEGEAWDVQTNQPTFGCNHDHNDASLV